MLATMFLMRWPVLNRQVRCRRIDHNQAIFEWWIEQLPLRAVQTHPVVSGWVLSFTAVRARSPWLCDAESVVNEDMSQAPDGRFRIKSDPVDGVTQVFVKYAQRTEKGPDITFANVVEDDLWILREVGASQWRSVMRTKQVITVEFERMEDLTTLSKR